MHEAFSESLTHIVHTSCGDVCEIPEGCFSRWNFPDPFKTPRLQPVFCQKYAFTCWQTRIHWAVGDFAISMRPAGTFNGPVGSTLKILKKIFSRLLFSRGTRCLFRIINCEGEIGVAGSSQKAGRADQVVRTPTHHHVEKLQQVHTQWVILIQELMLNFEALFGEVLMDKKCNPQHFTSLVPPKKF